MFKAGIIGLGQIGLTYDFDHKRERPSSHTMAYQLHPRVNLTAAADPNRNKKAQLEQITREAAFYSDYRDMLDAHPDFDILSICTPAEQRVDIIEDVLTLSAPRIIFCEKPLVRSSKEAGRLKNMVERSNCLFLPNLSRRWNSRAQQLVQRVHLNNYGALQKIHIRYTRGIYNTGSHMFDLISQIGGRIHEVRAIYEVPTTSRTDNEPSYSFTFRTERGIEGFAEAFDDRQYYMFEMDFYLSSGKIEFVLSGDTLRYYRTGPHPLFTGYTSLHLQEEQRHCLGESNMGNAIQHIVEVLDGRDHLICDLADGLHPIFVAEALERSYHNNGSIEEVDTI